MKARAALKGLAPALALGLLVLFVFATLQNYGPESAVRRFHEAVLTGDFKRLEETVYQPSRGPYASDIVGELGPILASGARIRLRDVDRRPSQVFVSVVYYLPDGRQGSFIWVTQKTQNGWKVDTQETWRYWHLS